MSKNLILIVAFVLTSSFSFGQGIFDKFEDVDGVTSVVVNQKMFKMLATMGIDLDDPEAQEFINMAKNITGFKVFTTGDEKISADMNATVKSYLKKSDLEELMRIKDGDQNVFFYIKEGKDENHVKELLMFIEDPSSKDKQAIVLSLTGSFNLDEISALTEKMNLPGGNELKKASKK